MSSKYHSVTVRDFSRKNFQGGGNQDFLKLRGCDLKYDHSPSQGAPLKKPAVYQGVPSFHRVLMRGSTNPYSSLLPTSIPGTYYTPSCDVYSFGVVLWEMITRHKPYLAGTRGKSLAPQSVLYRVATGRGTPSGCVQWNLCNGDTLGREESVLINEVS